MRDSHTTEKCTQQSTNKCKFCKEVGSHHYLLCDKEEHKTKVNFTEALYDQMEAQLAEWDEEDAEISNYNINGTLMTDVCETDLEEIGSGLPTNLLRCESFNEIQEETVVSHRVQRADDGN